MKTIDDLVKETLGAQGLLLLQLQAINIQQADRIAVLEKKIEDAK